MPDMPDGEDWSGDSGPMTWRDWATGALMLFAVGIALIGAVYAYQHIAHPGQPMELDRSDPYPRAAPR